MPETFTLVWPYYENPGQLRLQLDTLDAWDPKVAEQFQVIVVDDASPRNPAFEVIARRERCQARVKAYRIRENIPWNDGGARNLGAAMARDGWMLMFDIDNLLLPEEAAKLVGKRLDARRFYTFVGVNFPDLTPARSSPVPNHYAVTRRLYWKAGGNNEDFSGTYGGGSWLINNLLTLARREVLDVRLALVEGGDANTTEWDRAAYKEKYVALGKRRLAPARNPLRFHWERVW